MNSECGMVWGRAGQRRRQRPGLAGTTYMLNEYRLHENICGFVFTEFHDVINEFNGYYRIDNQKKNFGYDALGMGMQLKAARTQRSSPMTRRPAAPSAAARKPKLLSIIPTSAVRPQKQADGGMVPCTVCTAIMSREAANLSRTVTA